MTSKRAELWCKSNCPNQPRRMPGRLAPFPARRRAMLLVLVLVAVGWGADDRLADHAGLRRP
jgi:hypothetical protein